MFESDLLITKFTVPPVRTALLQRVRLLELLAQERLAPLTLLSASAGFGKTTLLASWASQYAGKVAWLALDEQDNDPTRFWLYVLAALRKSGSAVGTPTEALLHTGQSSLLTGALTSLINELAELPYATALVLDDYHLVREQTIHASLQFFLEHLPPNLYLLLACRADPALPLARLRARGQVAELREADLRLSQDEAVAFMRQVMKLPLTEEEIAHLETRTEGWITGLQLAALSLRKYSDTSTFLQTFTGSHRFILDYVQGEILAFLPPDQQRFLLFTSILSRLNAEICQTLTGEQASQQMLENLEQKNLFLIPLDEERRWYRFHTLFREVLLARLQLTQPEQVARLHYEAARWYRSHGYLHEAVSHALATRDYTFVAELLEAGLEPLCRQGELQTLLSWIKQIPLETLHALPRLSTTYLLIFNLLFPFTQQEQQESLYLQQLQHSAERYVLQGEQKDTLELVRQRLVVLDMWQKVKKALSAGDMEQFRLLAEQREPLELEDEMLWQQHGLAPYAIAWRMVGDFPPLIAAIQKLRQRARLAQNEAQDVHVLWGLIAAQIALGQLPEAHTSCLELRELIDKLHVPAPLAAYPPLFQAQIAYAWNKLDLTQNYARRAIHLTAPLQYMDILMASYEVLIRAHLALGDLASAQQALEAMEHAQHASGIPLFYPWIEGLQAQVWLAQGKLELAGAWAKQTPYRQEALTGSVYSREQTYLALVRIYLAQTDYAQALELLTALRASAEQVSRQGSILAIGAFQVAALQASGQEQEALSVLAQLLPIATSTGEIRALLDVGEPMHRTLQRWLTEQRGTPAQVAHVRTLLDAFTAGTSQERAMKTFPAFIPQPQTASPLLEPLTPRELEVLQLLAVGATNQEIAERLVVSLTTVKKHVGSLLLKLAADNRTHAVARARELSLLS